MHKQLLLTCPAEVYVKPTEWEREEKKFYCDSTDRFVSKLVGNPERPGPEVIKLFSSSAQLSMKFQLLINADIVKISGKFRFIPQNLVIYPAHKCRINFSLS